MSKLTRLINAAGLVFLILLALMFLFNLLKRNIYDSRLGINLLVIGGDGLGVVAIRPSAGLISLTRLPDNLMIPVDSSDAVYRAEAFYTVGLPTKNELKVSRTSVGQALGVVISGSLKTSGSLSTGELPGQLVAWSTRSDLSWIDRYRIFKDVSGILAKKTSLIIPFPANIADVSEEPDGKKVLKLNGAIFVWSKNQWVVDEVLSETAEVVIVNGTGTEGRARTTAHQLESAGIRVVELISAARESDDCLVWGDRKIHPRTYDYLVTSFGCRKAPGDISEYVNDQIESDVVLLLGKEN